MDASAPEWLQALEASSIGLAIRQSVWIYPAANVGHVVAVAAFAGALAVLDFALLGVIAVRERARLLLRARRWAVLLLVLVAATGLVLFTAEASHVALNPVFQAKLGLIVLGLANALVLGGRGVSAAQALPDAVALPAGLRIAAALSLVVWLGVVALGRLIAYI
jgi:hypothetical protein